MVIRSSYLNEENRNDREKGRKEGDGVSPPLTLIPNTLYHYLPHTTKIPYA